MLKHVKPILVQVHYTCKQGSLLTATMSSSAYGRAGFRRFSTSNQASSSSSTELFSARGDVSPGESGPSLVFIEGNQNDTNPSHVCTISYKYEHKNRHTFNRFLLHPWIDRLNVSTKPFEGDLRKKTTTKQRTTTV